MIKAHDKNIYIMIYIIQQCHSLTNISFKEYNDESRFLIYNTYPLWTTNEYILIAI